MNEVKMKPLTKSDAEVRLRLDAWLQPLRDVSPEPESESAQHERQIKTLNTIASAIRRAPVVAKQQRRAQQLIWAAAAVAVLAIGGAGYVQNHESTPELAAHVEQANLRQVVGTVVVTLPNGSDRVVNPDTQLGSGEEVSTTAQAFASLELEDQARVDLSSATTLKLERVVTRDHAFYLRSGRVDVNVPKVPGEARRLSVRTADALVSVRGTIFSVEVVEQDDRNVTIVQVSRGSVAVNSDGREVVLRSGQLWSSKPLSAEPPERVARDLTAPGPAEQAEAAPRIEPSPGASPEAGRAAESRSAVEASPEAERAAKSASESSLARQNELFERGLQARDSGDDKKATYWFDRLVSEYPSSPLIPSAKAEREKAQRRLAP